MSVPLPHVECTPFLEGTRTCPPRFYITVPCLTTETIALNASVAALISACVNSRRLLGRHDTREHCRRLATSLTKAEVALNEGLGCTHKLITATTTATSAMSFGTGIVRRTNKVSCVSPYSC